MKKKQCQEVREEKPVDYAITLEAKTTVQDMLGRSIDKVGPKKILHMMRGFCFRNTIEHSTFPCSLLATAKDEEQADTFAALYYLNKNWDECSKKGMKLIKAKMKEQSKKISTEVGEMHKEAR